MPLQTSGPISMQDIATEFGGSSPHSLNEYYAGGGLVPSGIGGTNGLIPSSGQISLDKFYGSMAVIPPNLNQWYINDTANIIRVQRQTIGPDYAARAENIQQSYSPPASTVYMDNAGWLYDTSTGLYYTLLRWCDLVTVTSYYIPSGCSTFTIYAWGGGGGAGGSWAFSDGGWGGGGGLAYGTWLVQSGGITSGMWIHTVAGHAGAGGEDIFYSGYGGGASFAWTTTSSISSLSTYDKIQTLNTSNLLLVAGGGGGGGASNKFYNPGGGWGGGGGNTNSGNNDNDTVSGSGAGATENANGTASIGPYANVLIAGAAGGVVGYTTSTLVTLGAAHPRNLMITIQQGIRLAGQEAYSPWVYPAGGGGGVFQGASGSSPMSNGSYGYSSRGGGGGASYVWPGRGLQSSNTVLSASYNAPSEENSRGRGGLGSYGNNGASNPNKSGNNGTPGRVRVIFNS